MDEKDKEILRLKEELRQLRRLFCLEVASASDMGLSPGRVEKRNGWDCLTAEERKGWEAWE